MKKLICIIVLSIIILSGFTCQKIKKLPEDDVPPPISYPVE